MRTFAADLAAGTASERSLLPVFNAVFGTSFQPTGKYDPVDYTSPTIDIELKTRTNRYRQYPTTMIPTSKLQYAAASPRRTIFAFQFTDGLYSIDYDPALFSTFETNEFQRTDRTDHTDRAQSYTYIPIKHLLPCIPNAQPVDPVAQALQ
jgi:hypothetical protein